MELSKLENHNLDVFLNPSHFPFSFHSKEVEQSVEATQKYQNRKSVEGLISGLTLGHEEAWACYSRC